MYQDMTADTAAAFRTSIAAGVQRVVDSMAFDYNRRFTLPLIPFALVDELLQSRFVVALALVFHVPFALAMGVVATQVCLH